VAHDLLGVCLAIKLFMACSVSPVTLQACTEHSLRVNEPSSAEAAGGQSQGTGTGQGMGTGGRQGVGRTQSLPSYNVINEMTVGTQFVQVMELLPSPSAVRAKLNYAAFVYIDKLKSKVRIFLHLLCHMPYAILYSYAICYCLFISISYAICHMPYPIPM
jgi:hypothetical protein